MRTVTLISILALIGCATGYKPGGEVGEFGFGGGFNETELDTNLYKVAFHGNGFTSTERAEELALLRSAEFTLKKGFNYFANASLYQDKLTVPMPEQSHTTFNATTMGNSIYGSANTTTYGDGSITRVRPTSTNTIMCFKEKPDIQGIIYSAQFLCNSLGTKYDVVCGKN